MSGGARERNLEVCPLEYRYGSEEMRELFSRENILRRELLVEKALFRALVEIGYAPSSCLEEIDECFDRVDRSEVDKLESETGHDVASLAIAIAERCGECGKYVHLGATSNDVIDSAWTLIVRDALGIVKSRLRTLVETLAGLSSKYRGTLMIGRTHGQHALPITFGFKLANYAYELARSYERICDLEPRLVRGKMAGAVGTMAAWMGRGLEVEREVMRSLGLEPHPITTQISPRDGIAELASTLAILASQLDRLALELRELSRPEIGEISFPARGIGSSAMPHKRNPVLAERVSGLARICRGLAISALENVVLMHERDLSNSSAERVLIPHLFLTVDQMLIDARRALTSAAVNVDRMAENVSYTKRVISSECLVVKLVLKAGVHRHVAHRMLSELAEEALRENRDFYEVVASSSVGKLLSADDIGQCFNYYEYLGNSLELIDRALDYARKSLERC